MAGTSVPQPTFGPNGFVAPAEADIYAGVFSDINAAFGGNLNPALETPQGQLATSFAAEIGELNGDFLYFVNGVDPALNSGRMQDAIGRIYFLTRIPAQSTTVECTCTGLAGTLIPTGAIAVDTEGNQYFCTAGGVIPVGGSITLPFAGAVTGPIACPATTLNTIYQAVPGWDSISNPADGVLGNDVETAAEFRVRRNASVALNSVGVLPAIKANVLQVPGVIDCYATENDTGSPVTIGGVSVAARSLYVCVSGGVPLAVATAIWRKKPPGCGYTGNTTETVYDSQSGYSPPYPSYSVTFETAIATPVTFAISIAASGAPANAAALIQAAVVNAFGGGDGGTPATIGSLIYALRFYPPIVALGSWVNVISIQLGSQNTASATFTGVLAGTALTVSGVTGTVAIGQTVVGAGVPDGTKIVSGSGTSWVVNSPGATVASETMYGVLNNQNDITMNINQQPVVSAANIAVTLV